MSQGRVYHLRPLFKKLNRLYFEGQVKCELAWGRVRASRVRRIRQLGRYEMAHNRIVLNRVLDRPQVPLYVIASVLHHEMCHAFIRPKKVRGRFQYHSPEFRAEERKYDQFAEARDWIKKMRKFLFQPPLNHLRAPDSSPTSQEQQLDLFGSSPP